MNIRITLVLVLIAFTTSRFHFNKLNTNKIELNDDRNKLVPNDSLDDITKKYEECKDRIENDYYHFKQQNEELIKANERLQILDQVQSQLTESNKQIESLNQRLVDLQETEISLRNEIIEKDEKIKLLEETQFDDSEIKKELADRKLISSN